MRILWTTSTDRINTHMAPLGILMLAYRHMGLLTPLQDVHFGRRSGPFAPGDHLQQLIMAILAGCSSVVQVNTRFQRERHLAAMLGWIRFADQSTLSRTLDRLSLTNFFALVQAFRRISMPLGGVWTHDRRRYLHLDVDLSALPASPRAEGSSKGYVSGKKTSIPANWPVFMPPNTARP